MPQAHALLFNCMGFDLLLAFVVGIRPPFAFKKVSSVLQRSVDNERHRTMSVLETSVGSLESCFTQSACIVDAPEDRYFTFSHTLFKNILALFFSGHNRDVSLWTAGSNGHLLWTGGYRFLLAEKINIRNSAPSLHPSVRNSKSGSFTILFASYLGLVGDAMQIQNYRSLRVSPWFYTTVVFGFGLRFVFLLLSVWTYLYCFITLVLGCCVANEEIKRGRTS